MNPISALLGALAAINTGFAVVWGKAMVAGRRVAATSGARTPATDIRLPNTEHVVVGFVTNFFDTLGIGSYAQTTAWYKLRKIVNDRIIPGTMTVGHNLSTMVQTFIYTKLVQVDVTTLFSMIGASIVGAWLGAGVVAKWSKRKVQIGMGSLLLMAATLMFLSDGGPLYQISGINMLPVGGDAIGVTGIKLVIAIAVNFVLGALMTLGIGLYAPCMITVYLLGMTPKAAFPIMMGSCAFLMPVAAIPFIKEKSYSNRPALGLTLGGIPGVLIAAYWVVSMNVNTMKWLVVAVVLYTAIAMLRSAYKENAITATAGEPIEVEA
jgi:uncharacterized membrane protein YfcA